MRLEEGTFKLPKRDATQTSVELKASELAMILDGIDLATRMPAVGTTESC